MLTGKRLLIVEAEALIALDIQRIAEESNAARVEIARDYLDLMALEGRLSRDYDLIILSPPRSRTEEMGLLGRLAIAGPALVVCTADLSPPRLPEGQIELVNKPFTDDQLLEACRRALARRPQLTSGCVS